ncbi:dienelactone hydrolase family protein [Agrococcus beijingensis]|uniref:dienelactone hydrolase family protein n=1 Tax=Agrococcus beijingensis TaxID=3068634 RepID=UPI0027406DCE|nr:dienelactone hydrolase family protein [Agrococcus sp. REN33]
MAALIARDIEHIHDGTRMLGLLVAPETTAGHQAGLPTVLLLHDAFGIGEHLIAQARRYASLGFAVFAADIWGDRRTPGGGAEIGPLIGAMAADRGEWMGRVAAAHTVAAAQPEVDPARIVAIGYCFGGAGALEYVRTGGDVLGAVSIHGGLDLLDRDWSAPTRGASALICTGSADPMATRGQREALLDDLDAAGIEWELDLYSGVEHAFTNPKSDLPGMPPGVAYSARASERAWQATSQFLADLFATQTADVV